MIDTLLGLAPSLLLVAGGCALAVWAKGLQDSQSKVVSRLTEPPQLDGERQDAAPDDRAE